MVWRSTHGRNQHRHTDADSNRAVKKNAGCSTHPASLERFNKVW
jgi:hypothetical protein